jgi:uncharacterized membrane protein YeiH
MTPGAMRTITKQAAMRSATAHMRSQQRKRWRHIIVVLSGIVCLLPLVLDRGRGALNNVDAAAASACNLIGDVAFAISGAVTAGEVGMDLTGCMLMGFVTALGGGSIRDTMLGITPLFWMTQPVEMALTMGVAALTFFFWGPLTRSRLRVTSDDEWLFWIDSLGLGVFAVNGANTAHGTGSDRDLGVHFGGAMFCGLSTACFGGLVRDLCCQNRVRILYAEKELYALPALAGAATHLGFLYASDDTWVLEGLCAGTWVTMLLRVVAVDHFVLMPTFSSANIFNVRNPLDSARRRKAHNNDSSAAYTTAGGEGHSSEPLLVGHKRRGSR